MENQIVCPNCKKPVTDQSFLEAVTKGEGTTTRSVECDCGERITYWQVTAMLRDQKSTGQRFQKWLRARLPGRG